MERTRSSCDLGPPSNSRKYWDQSRLAFLRASFEREIPRTKRVQEESNDKECSRSNFRNFHFTLRFHSQVTLIPNYQLVLCFWMHLLSLKFHPQPLFFKLVFATIAKTFALKAHVASWICQSMMLGLGRSQTSMTLLSNLIINKYFK